MLNLGAHARFKAVGRLIRVGQRRIAVGPRVGEVLGVRCDLLQPLTLFLAPVSAVAVEAALVAAQPQKSRNKAMS